MADCVRVAKASRQINELKQSIALSMMGPLRPFGERGRSGF
jgi:hypothetical protein